MCRILFILGILFSFSSCQEQYSNAIITEYFELDESLKHSNRLIEETSIGLIMRMEKDAITRTKLQFLVEKSKKIKYAVIDLKEFIMRLRETLVVETGGYEEEALSLDKLIPKGAKNTVLVEQILFSKHPSKSDSNRTISKVKILEQKMKTLHTAYLQVIESCWDEDGLKGTIFADFDKKQANLNQLKKELSLYAFENYQAKEHKQSTWADFNFKNKPLAAVYPMLRKIENDILVSEYMFINFLSSQFSTHCNFPIEIIDIFVQSSTPSINLGETYKANLVLGTFSPEANFNILINNDTLKSLDGRVIYSTQPNKVGEQKYSAQVNITNPLTGETTSFSKEFSFHVIP